ncbi:DUF6541 family protein [Amycolatopsis sp. CA-230715]|uniref:DUF6541 family protein n=1 Tax=Amycolatopsis sp. CA-230715 TaxID=2745196 RepID=UPI001C00E031|nr:DUF6541 family protein [Amycolatopsis sp. CA-230715]QWF80206.1 hypothetical protein HUW46_03625 [Amycolatopsis sp. CA-230715]
MPTPDEFWTYSSTIGVYLLVLVVPGGLVGFAAGLRGWALAGLAPLLTYTATGLAGPWLSYVDLPYNVGTAAASTVLLAGIAFGVRKLAEARGWVSATEDRPPVEWTRGAHLAVAACVVVATALSIYVVLAATGGTNAVFQRWDTVFHANGIRYIADTGDGGLFGMSTVNYYEPGGALFYPNAYHLVAALVYNLSGASIPVVLNAVTVPVAGIFALSMVAMVRQFGGRAMLAGSTALIAATATTGAYESVSSGLLPFALGIVLTPLAALVLQRFLERPGVDTASVLAISAAGLLASHSSCLFGGILFALPVLIQRWWRREGKVGRDLLWLLPTGAAAAVLAAPMVLGAIGFTSGAYPYKPWASGIPVPSALGQLLTFRQVLDQPQTWLAGLLVVGIVAISTLGRMRWVGLSAVLLSGIFVLVACFGAQSFVVAFSRPWWNDRFRLMALAAIPLILLAGHGLAELQRLVSRAVANLSWVKLRPRLPATLGLTTAVVMVAVLAVVTNGFYTAANATAVAYAYHNGPASEHREPPVTRNEITAMLELEKIAKPGEMVLNDRLDGTAWVYAIAGVRPVAGNYDPGVPPKDAAYLTDHFREYKTNPEVRAAVERLDVGHVLLGTGTIEREPVRIRGLGLTDLDHRDFLKVVYRNPGAVIYEIIR